MPNVFLTIINATGAKMNFDNLDGVDLLPLFESN